MKRIFLKLLSILLLSTSLFAIDARGPFATSSNISSNIPDPLFTTIGTAAQPNITSLGTIAALSATTGTFSGNIDVTNGVHISAGGSTIPSAAAATTVVIGQTAGAALEAGAHSSVIIGNLAGEALTAGNENIFIGAEAARDVTDGENNVIIGRLAADEENYSSNTIIGFSAAGSIAGNNNIILGQSAAPSKTSGENNVIIGGSAAGANVTGENSIYLGNTAGRDETGSAVLFIDSLDRGSEAAGRTDSLIYGVFNATPASQTLALNANVGVTYLLSRSQATKDAAYTAATEEYLFCDATGGAFSITLPAVSAGLQYTIKKTDSSANAVTIDGNASETIDGELTQILTTQYDAITIVSDGTSWFTI